MGKGLAIFIFTLLFLAQIAVIYVLVPFVLIAVLGFFGITLSFWIAVAIVFLVNFTVNIFKRN